MAKGKSPRKTLTAGVASQGKPADANIPNNTPNLSTNAVKRETLCKLIYVMLRTTKKTF